MKTEKPDNGDFQAATAEAVGALELEKAAELIKFYVRQADTVKARTWTITTWVLTLNTALFAFGVKLYTDSQEIAEEYGVRNTGSGLTLRIWNYLARLPRGITKPTPGFRWASSRPHGLWL